MKAGAVIINNKHGFIERREGGDSAEYQSLSFSEGLPREDRF